MRKTSTLKVASVNASAAKRRPRAVAAQALPLTHAVAIIRPLLFGQLPASPALHIAVLAAITVTAFWLALGLTRRLFTPDHRLVALERQA